MYRYLIAFLLVVSTLFSGLVNVSAQEGHEVSFDAQNKMLTIDGQPYSVDFSQLFEWSTSPSGEFILLEVSQDSEVDYEDELVIFDTKTQLLQKITDGNGIGTLMLWHPTQDLVVFKQYFGQFMDSPIMSWTPEQGTQQLTPVIQSETGTVNTPISWSPDGQWLLFQSTRDEESFSTNWMNGLYVIRPDGSDMRWVSYRPRFILDSTWVGNNQIVFTWWAFELPQNFYSMWMKKYQDNLPHGWTQPCFEDCDNNRLHISTVNISNPLGTEKTIKLDIHSADYLYVSEDGQYLLFFVREDSMRILRLSDMTIIQQETLGLLRGSRLIVTQWQYGQPISLRFGFCSRVESFEIEFTDNQYDWSSTLNEILQKYPEANPTKSFNCER